MEYLDIKDVVTVANEFLMNPTDKEKVKALDDIRHKLVIKRHLPIAQRENIILRSLMDVRPFDTELNLGQISNLFEMSLTFNIALSYTNIDPDYSSAYKTELVYDILWESGLMDHILKFCKDDYERVEKQFYQIVSFSNFVTFTEDLKTLKPENLEKMTEEFKNFESSFNETDLKKLVEIAQFSDPVMGKLKDGVLSQVNKTVDKAFKEQNEAENGAEFKN